MYKISLHKKAVKYYQSLDNNIAKRINKAIDEMRKNPLEGANIKRLKGRYEGKYRYKVGGLRIVYRVAEDAKTILVEAIGPRGDIYK